MAKWKKGFQPTVVADALNHWIIQDGTQSEGSVKIRGFGYSRELILLSGIIDFDESISELESKAIVSRSVAKVAHRGKISAEKLLHEIRKQERSYKKRPLTKYRLHTTISIGTPVKLPRTYFSGSYISVGGKTKSAVVKSRKHIVDRHSRFVRGDYPDYYSSVAVTVAGRTPNEAAHTALERLNYVRGLWNIQINRGSFRESSSRPDPINRIILGPAHTLHNMQGEIAANQFWYDNSYIAPIQLFNAKSQVEHILGYTKNVLEIDKSHQYSSDLRRAVVRYAEVLDGWDMDGTILGLWGILELLTDTKDKNYDVLIRRAAFVFEDYDKAKEILRHIRVRRNEYAHGGSTTSGAEVLVHQLKSFVEKLIGFHLGLAEKYEFKDIREFAAMLDLPPDESSLNRRKKLVSFAYKLRHDKG